MSICGYGYVFLDEIGEMPLMQQTKLLRVLQERQVQRVGSSDVKDVSFRSISATNVNLKEAIAKKTFREDLFYRVNKMIIQVPALRDRLATPQERWMLAAGAAPGAPARRLRGVHHQPAR